nr:MFS transporter [Pseudomonas putida]
MVSFVGTCAIAGLNLASMFSARLVVPLVALSMGANALFAGVTAAMFTMVPMFASLGFGRWLDRTGTLWPMTFAASLAVITALVFTLTPHLFALPVVAGLAGAGGVFAHMAATQAIGVVEDVAHRTRDLGYLVLGYSLFQFSGPLIVGATYQYLGSTAAMLALGAFSLISLVVLALGWHMFLHENRQAPTAKSARPTRLLLAHAELRTWILISSVFVAAQSIYPFVLSLHISQVGLGALEAGWILGASLSARFYPGYSPPC